VDETFLENFQASHKVSIYSNSLDNKEHKEVEKLK